MAADLIINGVDARKRWGVGMGDEFLNALDEPLTPKTPISSESRLEDGKRIILDPAPKWQSRDLTLDFTIQGVDEDDMRIKKSNFIRALQRGTAKQLVGGYAEDGTTTGEPADYTGLVSLSVPKAEVLRNDDGTPCVYRLVYLGKGNTYGLSASRCLCHIMFKFAEPDPTDRGAQSRHQV